VRAHPLVATDNRDEWLAARRRHIGGSDLPAILGLSPFMTPAEVAAVKLGLIDGAGDTPAMRRGRALEDAVARMWAEDTGRRIRRVRATMQAADHPLMVATVDRLALGPVEVLEVKTAGARAAAYWEGDEPPAHAALQVQHYLRVLDLSVGHIAALVAGDLRSWVLHRDDALVDEAWSYATAWWERYVARGVLPEPSAADTSLLRRLYGTAEPGRVVDLPPQAADALAEYARALADEKAAATRREWAENRLKAWLGQAEVGLLGGAEVVTWRAYERRDLDTARLRAEMPDVAERYARTSTVRRFSVRQGVLTGEPA
jgi:putative phage-type endonuclease